MAEPGVPKKKSQYLVQALFSIPQLLHIGIGQEKCPAGWIPDEHGDGSALHKNHGSRYTSVLPKQRKKLNADNL